MQVRLNLTASQAVNKVVSQWKFLWNVSASDVASAAVIHGIAAVEKSLATEELLDKALFKYRNLKK